MTSDLGFKFIFKTYIVKAKIGKKYVQSVRTLIFQIISTDLGAKFMF